MKNNCIFAKKNKKMKQKDILAGLKNRYGINELNEMQKEVLNASNQDGDIILLSPTGSGKTIAFLTPVLKALKEPNGNLQAVIIAFRLIHYVLHNNKLPYDQRQYLLLLCRFALQVHETEQL